MATKPTKAMKGNRSTETSIEVAVRKALWAEGLRGYRKNVRSLPGKPDIVFSRQRVIIDIRGCFWHRCPVCAGKIPRENSDYWDAKMARNAARDEANRLKLETLGYSVLVFWEHEIAQDLGPIVRKVCERLGRPSKGPKSTRSQPH